VFICVPKLGLLHWHPFSIASARRDAKLELFLDASGRWTGRLAALAQEQSECKVQKRADRALT
jgi:predicted ferric reductase